MKSDSIDYMIAKNDEYPLSVVLFYDSGDMEDELVKYLCDRLLDIYVLKKKAILERGGNLQGLASHKASTQAYESAIPLILENVSSLNYLTI